MKAAVVTEQGVQYTDAPKPSPKANEILIKVKAASLNRADLALYAAKRDRPTTRRPPGRHSG